MFTENVPLQNKGRDRKRRTWWQGLGDDSEDSAKVGGAY
jgi:hypothetical protein